jgi:hypothetical protein
MRKTRTHGLRAEPAKPLTRVRAPSCAVDQDRKGKVEKKKPWNGKKKKMKKKKPWNGKKEHGRENGKG